MFNMVGLREKLFKKSCTPNSRLLLHHPTSKRHLSPLEARWTCTYFSDGRTYFIEDSIHFLGFCNIKIMPLYNSPQNHSILSEDELFYLQYTASISTYLFFPNKVWAAWTELWGDTVIFQYLFLFVWYIDRQDTVYLSWDVLPIVHTSLVLQWKSISNIFCRFTQFIV